METRQVELAGGPCSTWRIRTSKTGVEVEGSQRHRWAVKLQVEVPQWLLSNPSGPLRKEQEQSLLPETIYSRQQADMPALQSAASDLLQRRELLRSEILWCRSVHGMARNRIRGGVKALYPIVLIARTHLSPFCSECRRKIGD